MEESKERSLRLSLGSLGVEGGQVRGRWSDIRRGQGFAEPMKCRDLPLAGAARAVRIRRIYDWAWAVSKRVRGWTHKRRTRVGFGLLRNIFMKARESRAALSIAD